MNRCDLCGAYLYLADNDVCPLCLAESARLRALYYRTQTPTLLGWLRACLNRIRALWAVR